jgi:hypothetical protein
MYIITGYGPEAATRIVQDNDPANRWGFDDHDPDDRD